MDNMIDDMSGVNSFIPDGQKPLIYRYVFNEECDKECPYRRRIGFDILCSQKKCIKSTPVEESVTVSDKVNVVLSWATSIKEDADSARNLLLTTTSIESQNCKKALIKIGEVIGACEAIIASMNAANSLESR